MTTQTQRRHTTSTPSTWKRLLRAYGPLLLIALGFLLMAWLIPSIDRAGDTQSLGNLLHTSTASMEVIR